MGIIAATAAMILGPGAANAAPLGVYPQFSTPGNGVIRQVGSETLFQLTNSIDSLFSQSQIFGCTQKTSDYRTCNTATGDNSATDTFDNYSRTEVLNGLGDGSGTGAGQLCPGGKPTGGLVADMARMSRNPKSSDCTGSTLQGLQIAADAVPIITFPNTGLTAPTCAAGDTCSATPILPPAAGYRFGDVSGTPSGLAFNNLDNRGVPSLGGKSVAFEIYCDKSTAINTTVTSATFTTGSTTVTANTGAFTQADVDAYVIDLTNSAALPTAGNGYHIVSVATNGLSAVLSAKPAVPSTTDALQIGTGFGINDWQQLTDPTVDPAARVGPPAGDATASVTLGSTSVTTSVNDFSSADIGATITDASGFIPAGTTVAAVVSSTSIVLSAAATGTASPDTITLHDILGREGKGTINASLSEPIYIPFINTGSGTYATFSGFVGCDPNTKNTDGLLTQENDAPQLSDDANHDHPTDNIAADNQIESTLYYISKGVSTAKTFTTSVFFNSGAASTPSFGVTGKCNNVSPSPLNELQGTAGVACGRGLFYAYVQTILRGSLAGYLNWVCDTDAAGGSAAQGAVPPSGATHGEDLTTGKNYSAELTNLITTQFVFPRTSCGRVDGTGTNTALFPTNGYGTVSYGTGSTTVLDTQAQGPRPARIINDADLTTGSTIIKTDDNQGHFGPLDVGAAVSDSGNTLIPAGTTIASVTNSNTAVLSAAALGTTPPSSLDTVTITDTVAVDQGQAVSGVGIPAGTTITAVTPGVSFTISATPTALGTAIILPTADPVVPSDIVRLDGTGGGGTVVVTSGSNVVSDTQIGIQDNNIANSVGPNFEVGEAVSGTGIPAGTTITAVTPGVSFTMSASATASGTSVTVADTNV